MRTPLPRMTPEFDMLMRQIVGRLELLEDARGERPDAVLPDLSEYARVAYVNAEIASIDLSPYALRTQLFSGAYGDLTGRPDLSLYALQTQLFSGAYGDLTGRPNIPTLRNAADTYSLIRSLLQWDDIQGKPTLAVDTTLWQGTYADLTAYEAGHIVVYVDELYLYLQDIPADNTTKPNADARAQHITIGDAADLINAALSGMSLRFTKRDRDTFDVDLSPLLAGYATETWVTNQHAAHIVGVRALGFGYQFTRANGTTFSESLGSAFAIELNNRNYATQAWVTQQIEAIPTPPTPSINLGGAEYANGGIAARPGQTEYGQFAHSWVLGSTLPPGVRLQFSQLVLPTLAPAGVFGIWADAYLGTTKVDETFFNWGQSEATAVPENVGSEYHIFGDPRNRRVFAVDSNWFYDASRSFLVGQDNGVNIGIRAVDFGEGIVWVAGLLAISGVGNTFKMFAFTPGGTRIPNRDFDLTPAINAAPGSVFGKSVSRFVYYSGYFLVLIRYLSRTINSQGVTTSEPRLAYARFRSDGSYVGLMSRTTSGNNGASGMAIIEDRVVVIDESSDDDRLWWYRATDIADENDALLPSVAGASTSLNDDEPGSYDGVAPRIPSVAYAGWYLSGIDIYASGTSRTRSAQLQSLPAGTDPRSMAVAVDAATAKDQFTIEDSEPHRTLRFGNGKEVDVHYLRDTNNVTRMVLAGNPNKVPPSNAQVKIRAASISLAA